MLKPFLQYITVNINILSLIGSLSIIPYTFRYGKWKSHELIIGSIWYFVKVFIFIIYLVYKLVLVICTHQLATGNFLYNRNDVYIDRVSFLQIVLNLFYAGVSHYPLLCKSLIFCIGVNSPISFNAQSKIYCCLSLLAIRL